MEIKKNVNIKLESVFVTVPVGNTANQVYTPDAPYKPDDTFKNIIGVYAEVLAAGDADYILLQLKDQYKVSIDPVPSGLLFAGESAGADDKFRSIKPIPCDGRSVSPGVVVPNVLATEVLVCFVFLLSDELIQVER